MIVKTIVFQNKKTLEVKHDIIVVKRRCQKGMVPQNLILKSFKVS